MKLPLDRGVTVYLTSGQSLTGALAESPDNQIILFEPRSRASSHYHTVPLPVSAPGPTCEVRTRMSCISTAGNI